MSGARFVKVGHEVTGLLYFCAKCFKFHYRTEMEAFRDTTSIWGKEFWCGKCLKKEFKRLIPEKSSWKAEWARIQERLFLDVKVEPVKPHLVWQKPPEQPKEKKPVPELNLEI